jgi:hypothetical protein
MATTMQTYNGMTVEQRSYYEKQLLIRALPNLVHAQFGQRGRSIVVPDRSGLTVDWR